MASASDWTFCWKLNAPASSSASSPQSKSKRKRPVSAPIPTQEKNSNNAHHSSNGSILIMDNIKLPFTETWCAAMPVEPKKRTTKTNPAKFHQTVTLGNQKTVNKPQRRQSIHTQQPQRQDDQFIAGMMQRVELDLFPQDFIQRPAEHTAFPRNDLRRTQSHPADKYSPQEMPNFTQIKRESFVEDEYLNLVATPESGGANHSGDEYSPDVTPISTSDQSFLHFLNDETIPLEISSLMENGAFEVEVPSQDLFNCDPSWLNCFDP